MILKVPYYSQFKETKSSAWQDKSCGIAALKMVLDFHQPTNLSIDELFQKGLEIGGYLENVGWYHHSLAILAKNLGFEAITRSWNVTKESIEKLKQRGFDDKDLEIMKEEQLEEGLYTLKQELSSNHPVIISFPGHLVVLVGFDQNNFYVNDPDDREQSGQKVKVVLSEFKKIWEKRAIIIY